MDQERQRADDIGYDDPINPTYEDTNESYHRCLDMSLDTIQARGQTNIMVATHNLDTVRHAVQRYGAGQVHLWDQAYVIL